MRAELKGGGASLDAIYYCRHHPEGTNPKYRMTCGCRKPKPGLLLQAAQDMDIDLKGSYMVGDGIMDIEAGRSAQCKTIYIGRRKCEMCCLMEEKGIYPDFTAPSLLEAVRKIKGETP
jgi:D-glycero-D-manno-heptose 1,7-bisphosphate phosphatase